VKEPLVLAATSAVFVLGSIAALVMLVLDGTILSLDGLMILAVGGLIAAVFTWFALAALKEARPPKDGKPPADSGEKTA
jgi:hypothetical protein